MAVVSAMSFTVLLLAISVSVRGLKTDDRSYEEGEYIPLFVNILQPNVSNSRCESCPYFSLPFCPPGDEIPNRKKSLDEILLYDCWTNTQYELRFKEGKTKEILCEKNLTREEVAKFRDAVRRNFEYQMSFSDILVWGPVGKTNFTKYPGELNQYTKLKRYSLVQHIEFDCYYLDNQVKDIRLRGDFDSVVNITEDIGVHVRFTYSVFWRQWSELSLRNYSVQELMPKYHWPTEWGVTSPALPIYFCVSYIVAWIALLGLVIEPYLHYYFKRNSYGEVEEGRQQGSVQIHSDVEEGRVHHHHKGSKQIHGETCRCPQYSSLLGAFIGVGAQLLILICMFFILSYTGVLDYCDEEQMNITYYLVIYCPTSLVSGYTATSFNSRYNPTGWKECVFQTGALYIVPGFLTFLMMGLLSQHAKNFSDLPLYKSLFGFTLAWGVGTISLLILGGLFGHGSSKKTRLFCPTNRIPRLVSRSPWYMRTPAQVVFGGILPFVTVFWEMDKIFASLFYHKVCGALRTLVMAFIQITGMTILVGMGYTYIQLSNHDHQWWWRSVLRGGSTAVLVFIYGIYFFVRARPGETIGIIFFVGNSASIFYTVFLALGTVGFCASLLVFRIMYRGSLKNE